MAVVTVVSTRLNLDAGAEQAKSMIGVVSEINVRIVALWLEQKEEQTKTVTTVKRVRDFSKNHEEKNRLLASEFLKGQSEIYPELISVWLVDATTGKVIADSKDGKELGTDVSGFEFWSRRATSATYVGTTLTKHPLTGKYCMLFSRTIMSESGTPESVVVFAVDWFPFAEKELGTIRIGKTGYVYVFDSTGQIVYHPVDKSLVMDGKAPTSFRKIAAEKKNYFQRGLYKGEWKLYDSSLVERNGWIVMANVPEAELTSGTIHASNVSLQSAFGVLAAAALISLFMARRISKPISEAVNRLSSSAELIAGSSDNLSSSSQAIASGATEQAAGVEETSASMVEVASMVKQNRDNARESSKLTAQATKASQQGNAQMEKMLRAMTSINESAGKIRSVIDVIDSIAFQTNILALNASVEAARAGEAGRGFSVVANEVTNLAGRSQESAKETAKMLKSTIESVEEGMEISRELSEVFKTIVTNSNKAMQMSKEVETASAQQDEGISQVNKAIGQFDAVVQTNAATAEETAGSAEEMRKQVGALNAVVNSLHLIVTGKEYEKTTMQRTTVATRASASIRKRP
jgi:methyl-accepting chemotaxis protein